MHKWIDELNSSQSRIHKETVIKKILTAHTVGAKEATDFLKLLNLCYNPFINFNVKQVPETVGLTNNENPWDDFTDFLETLHFRKVTGNAARDAISLMSQRFDSEEWNKVCAPVIRKDMRVGISDKTINKVCKKTEFEIPIFTCQLATSCEGRPEMSGKKRLEPKLDGVRVLMEVKYRTLNDVSVTCYSRNGKIFENFTHIEDQVKTVFAGNKSLYDKFVSTTSSKSMSNALFLDGEVVGKSFQELMRQARRKNDVSNDDSSFYIFDLISGSDFINGFSNKQLKKRLVDLEYVFAACTLANADTINKLPFIEVDLDTPKGVAELEQYAKDQVSLGFEGIMIKDMESPYECKRSTSWMKWKPTSDYDLTIIGVEEGTGRNQGRMGALICEGVDGGKHIVVNVGSGYSDEERQEYWDNQNVIIGRTAVVIADAVTQNQDGSYSLRFPRFKTFRDDK